MALQSQAGRPGYSRQHMVSGRKSRKGPWVAVLLLALVVGGGYMYFYGGSTPTTGNTPGNAPEDGGSAVAAADTGDRTETRTPSTSNRQQRQTPRNTNNAGSRTTDIPDLGEDDVELTREQRDQYEQGMQLVEDGKAVEGRAILSELLFRSPGSLPHHEAQAIRDRLTHLNQTLVFSDIFVEHDSIAQRHTVQSGEYLSRIGPAYGTPYQFIMRINGITNAASVPAGATLKCIRGPIHARIVKHEYRMDLYVEDAEGLRIYLCSYPVGLGEFDSTPVGMWRIKPRSKVVNPDWRNPRTGEYYERDDPGIPIGEYWMALEGMDDNTREHAGYGIHGTNDPDSIGQQQSMGCVRMQATHVEEVFYMLSSGDSSVEILP